ncbi:hypothetical protein SISSUDRAFT_973899, partial [Sistotremastrum suecicum HHB10207 ss-3]
IFTATPFLAGATADTPGMAFMGGFVGHQGRVHCRLHCPLIGRRKDESGTYYPAAFRPHQEHDED